MAPEPPTGASIGPYRIVRKLGEGGMGSVYLAHDARLGRHVALKTAALRRADSGPSRERLLSEARAAAGLSHPNIAGVYDVIEADGDAYIVMEYVEGESLAARLDRGPLRPADAAAIGTQVAAALEAAHARGIVHRDLKPANIQLSPQGVVKILDFGIARVAPTTDDDSRVTITRSPLTKPGVVLGTPAYMSPEQVEGRPVGPPSDVFSLGVILFETLTGRRPFEGRDSMSLAVAIATAPAPDLRALAPTVPEPLTGIVSQALDKQPERRPTAVALRTALADSARERPVALGLATTRTNRRAPVRGPALAQRWLRISAPLVALALGGGWLAVRVASRPAGAPSPAVLAVLPPTYLGDEATLEAVGAGLTSVLTGTLGSVPGLTVVSRTSTAAYTGPKRQNLAKVAREVGASLIVDLALQTATAGVRVRATLMRFGGSANTWRGTYERDALSVQRDVIEGIAHALVETGAVREASWTAATRSRLLRLPTSSSEAFDLYAHGRALLDRRDVADNRTRAVALFEAAVARDPQFALGYAGLTDAYAAMYQATHDAEWVRKAGGAADRALALDPDQPAVRYSLASLRFATGEPTQAINELRLAIALQPDNDEPHRLLGRILAAQGQVDAGVAEVRQAIALRPEYGGHYFMLGFILYNAGRYREAADAYRRVTELQPDFAGGFEMLGTTYHVLGDTQRAIGYYEHAVRLGPSATAYANMGYFYYVAGRFTDALTAYQAALEREPNSPETMRNLGDVFARLGQNARARSSYERAVSVLNRMLTVNRQDASAIGLQALCEAKLGRHTDAERHAAEALALAPTDGAILVRNAEVAAWLGQTDLAMAHLARAVARGYQVTLLRDDDDLAGLRARPDFQALVAARSGEPLAKGVTR